MPIDPEKGCTPMNIQGRTCHERERLLGMTDQERAWRAKWLKDQELASDEPKPMSQELYRERYNIIRRIYRAPLQPVERALVPIMGADRARGVRYLIGRSFMGYIVACIAWYYFKYPRADWTNLNGWRMTMSLKKSFPGEPEYPKWDKRTRGDQFAQLGFNNPKL